MKGGADTGFRKVKPEEYAPRLLHFSGTRKNVEVREVTRNKSSLKSDDVFILDQGLQIYQWNGSGSNKDERMKVAKKKPLPYCFIKIQVKSCSLESNQTKIKK